MGAEATYNVGMIDTSNPAGPGSTARFAFAGRCSTEDNQDPDSSRAWQLSRATTLIQPFGGVIVAEYFDIGQSRALPWKRRPRSAELLEALRDPARGFEAVVVGEPHRMFYGNQFGLIFPLFVHFGVELWVPEMGGRVDPTSDAHDMMMLLFGGLSKAERNRIKVRVRAAMAAQAATEGRFLGGRPPYGYRLVEVGPHPNPAKAADGRMLRQLSPDPETAPVVQRIFSEYLAGVGLFAIAEGLTRDAIPSPSAYDRARNPHRRGQGWAKSAVRAILLNPRYCGRQVWNRQRRVETLIDVDDVALGHETKMRWNGDAAWVWSQEMSHEPLVSPEEVEEVRARLRATARRSADRRPRSTPRPYMLRSLIFCGLCDRRMQGTWNNGKPHYRCQFPNQYASTNDRHPKAVYVREALVVPAVDQWLATLLDADHVEATIDAIAGAAESGGTSEAAASARRTIARCDARLASYRTALDAGGDPVTIGRWIADVIRHRDDAARDLSAAEAAEPKRPSRDDVARLIAEMGGAIAMLREADPQGKQALYERLGLRMTYYPQDRKVIVEALPGRPSGRSGGGSGWPEPPATPAQCRRPVTAGNGPASVKHVGNGVSEGGLERPCPTTAGAAPHVVLAP